ncbi:MAG TPA: nuclear transport factor 2 family protein [Burkholderiaceae bacterium]|nr:nuclear transport factor 2 family protein [Burkholderiaceae bacterium]
MEPVERVQQMYAAFGRGDVPAILAGLAEDVEWEYGAIRNPVPWLQPYKGRAQVPQFFEALAKHIDLTQFEPRTFLQQGLLVVDLVDVAFTVRATGKHVVEAETVHIWHFNAAGLVQRFRHRVDTWASAQALIPS